MLFLDYKLTCRKLRILFKSNGNVSDLPIWTQIKLELFLKILGERGGGGGILFLILHFKQHKTIYRQWNKVFGSSSPPLLKSLEEQEESSSWVGEKDNKEAGTVGLSKIYSRKIWYKKGRRSKTLGMSRN